MRTILNVVLALFTAMLVFSGCYERIDAGHVGVKVNLYGNSKGVDNVTEVTGWVFYNPFTTAIYEFPTFVQHKEYSGNPEDGGSSFTVNSKDGSEFRVSPLLNYRILPDKVPYIFAKYRKPLGDIEEGFLKTSVFDAFRIASNAYTADSLISNREKFEVSVRKLLEEKLVAEGFVIEQFTSNLEYPKTFVDAINAKNNAVQQTLRAENLVKTAVANADIKRANAKGVADSILTIGNAEVEIYRRKAAVATDALARQTFVETWNGVLPVYGEVPTLFKDIQK